MVKSGEWTLVHDNGERTPVLWGDDVKTFRGDFVMVTGGTPPAHSGSSGRVNVRYPEGPTAEYYPSVANLKWVRA